MSVTIQQILSDAKRLAGRLKEHDSAADELLSQTQSVFKQLDTMKQYQEDVNELNEVARQRPHSALAAGIQQENRHLRMLQQENRELRASLEEYQNAVELIMSKYRQQMDALIRQNKVDVTGRLQLPSCVDKFNKDHIQIAEMADVMRKVAAMDEESTISPLEKFAQITTENRGLREILQISRETFHSTLDRESPDEELAGAMPMAMTMTIEHRGVRRHRSRNPLPGVREKKEVLLDQQSSPSRDSTLYKERYDRNAISAQLAGLPTPCASSPTIFDSSDNSPCTEGQPTPSEIDLHGSDTSSS